MSYATKQDLFERFGEDEITGLADPLGQGAIDDVTLARVLADADGEIDSYLSVRYPLPLASTPPVLTRIACDITRFLLYRSAVPEIVATRYRDAVRLLKGIAAGEVNLGVEAASALDVEAGAEFASEGRTFSRESTAGY